MPLSDFAKRALREKLESFESSKLSAAKRLQEIEEDREQLIAMRNKIDQAITLLKADLQGA